MAVTRSTAAGRPQTRRAGRGWRSRELLALLLAGGLGGGAVGALLQSALQRLTPAERTAFVLRHMEDCTAEEIAAALGIAPNAAKQAVFRAVKKLRIRLAALRGKR